MAERTHASPETELPVDTDVRPVGGPRDGRPSRRRAERTVVAVVAMAGGLGALVRDGVSHLASAPVGTFPWSTFWINVSGSAVIGLVLVLLVERFPRARLARPLVVTGFLGAYTTYSTYMVDADLLVRAHHLLIAAAYVLASLLAGFAAVAGGILLGRLLVRLDHHLGESLG